jgi:hypothetical protein
MENRANKALRRLGGNQLDEEWVQNSEKNGPAKDLGGASREVSK